MDVNALYNVAKGFVNKIQNEKPALAAESDAAICLILTDDEEIYSGVTGMGIHNGNIVSYPAECVALIAMFASGVFKAKQLIVISMEDHSVAVPCVECLDMLLLLDTGNDACEIAVSEDRIVPISELMSDGADAEEAEETSDISSASVDYFSGFGNEMPEDVSDSAKVYEGGFDESYSAPQHEPVKKELGGNASLGAPAEFASEVEIDESNPFNERSETVAESDGAKPVGILTEKASNAESAQDQKAKTLSKAELLKQAKKKKKVAKSNFSFFKKKQ